MEGDLLSSLALASILRTQTAKNESPTQQVQGVQVGITSDQIDQLSDSIGQSVRSAVQGIQLPDINVPPAQVQFPSNLQLSFSDTELARMASAISAKNSVVKQIETRVLTLNVDGTAVATSFPLLKRLVTYQFTQDYNLVAGTLSCSIINISTQVAGLFLGRDLGEQINIVQQSDTQTASDIYISQLTHQNSTVSTIAPLSRTNTIAFGGDTSFIPIQAGTRLAVYACGENNGNNLYTAVINLHISAP
jgi:hypothetical protein